MIMSGLKYTQHPRNDVLRPIQQDTSVCHNNNRPNFTLYDILEHDVVSFNMGQSYAKMTVNNIGYELDIQYYSDPDFARGYAQSLGYVHGINGKEKNTNISTTDTKIKYESFSEFEQSSALRSRIMNAVNSKHTFIVTGKYKLEYTRGWIYGQYEARSQHDTYSLEQQGFIYAQYTKKCAVAVLNHNIQLHIRPKFILGFCAGMGYRDYRNSDIHKKIKLPSEFDEIVTMMKNKCQVYYDLFYDRSNSLY